MSAEPGFPESREEGGGRHRRLIVPAACALSAAVLGLVVGTAVTGMRRPFSGFFWVKGSGSVIMVFSGTPAWAAGLREGDVLLTIGGVPTRLSVRRSIEAYAAPAVGEMLALSVLRSGRVRFLEVPMVAPPLLERLHALEIVFVAFCLAMLGFVVWAYKPYDATVALFLLFTNSLAVLVTMGWLSGSHQPWAFVAFDFSLAFAAAVSVHFHLQFPEPRAFPARRRLVAGLYGLALALPLLYLPGAGRDVDVEWYLLARRATRVWAAVAAAVALGLLLDAYRRAAAPVDRRRIRLVVFGTVAGIAPGTVLSLVPDVLGRARGLLVPYELTLPFLLLIPIAYIVAIQRYNPLRLERLIHRGVVHLVLVSILALVYLAVGVGLPRLLLKTEQPLIHGLAVLLIALLFAPLRARLQTLADRLFYGGWYDYASVLGEMTRALSGIVDADTLAGLLGARLARTLRLRGAALLVGAGENDLLLVEQNGWPWREVSSLPRGGALGLQLLRAAQPLSTGALRRAMAELPVTEQERSWLESPEIELWVPLVRGQVLHGLLVLGARAGGEPFEPEERRMLGTLAWSAAVAAENVQLVSALRRRADEINRLYSQLLQSREAERKRLARELHDRVIQDLINLHYFLDGATEAARQPVPGVRQTLRAVIDNLRQVCSELRPSALDDLDLGLAIQGYVDEIRPKYGFKVSLRLPEAGEDLLEALSEEARLGLFRVLQEAVTNVHRHAGAHNVGVVLATGAERVTLEVRDDGRGFTYPGHLGALVSGGHFGLAGAYERMSLIGGSLELESVPGRGTKLCASVPLRVS